MRTQTLIFCPRCGEALRGRFCAQCGFDSEIQNENRYAENGIRAEWEKHEISAISVPNLEYCEEQTPVFVEADPNEDFTAESNFLKENDFNKSASKLHTADITRLKKIIPYVGLIFSFIGLFLMAMPFGVEKDSSFFTVFFTVYRLSADLHYGNFAVLAILANVVLFFISLKAVNKFHFVVYALFGVICEILSLIGIGLLFSAFADNDSYAIVGGYVSLAFAVLGLIAFLAFLAFLAFFGLKHRPKTSEKEKTVTNYSKNKHKKKKITAFVLIGSVLCLAVIGISVFCGVFFSNKFRAEKIAKIEIGDTQAGVKKVLGTPNSANAREWVYYDSEYEKITRKLAETPVNSPEYAQLELERNLMTYKRIKVVFENGKVSKAEYDAEHVDVQSNIFKVYDKITLNPSKISYKTLLSRVSITASIYYKDGSFQKYVLPYYALQNVDTNGIGTYDIEWSDDWGRRYISTLEVTN